MQQDDNMRKIITCLIISFLLGPLVPIASASGDGLEPVSAAETSGFTANESLNIMSLDIDDDGLHLEHWYPQVLLWRDSVGETIKIEVPISWTLSEPTWVEWRATTSPPNSGGHDRNSSTWSGNLAGSGNTSIIMFMAPGSVEKPNVFDLSASVQGPAHSQQLHAASELSVADETNWQVPRQAMGMTSPSIGVAVECRVATEEVQLIPPHAWKNLPVYELRGPKGCLLKDPVMPVSPFSVPDWQFGQVVPSPSEPAPADHDADCPVDVALSSLIVHCALPSDDGDGYQPGPQCPVLAIIVNALSSEVMSLDCSGAEATFTCAVCEAGLQAADSFSQTDLDVVPGPHTKEALSAGRWSVQLVPEAVDLLHGLDSEATGSFAVVGDLPTDVPDQGSIAQDVTVHEGHMNIRGATREDGWLDTGGKSLACAGMVVALAGMTFATLGGALLFAATLLYVCDKAAASWADSGYIECGIVPSGVTWGGQSADSDLADTLSAMNGLSFDGASDSSARTTVFYDGDGVAVGGQGYIGIWNGPGYDEGRAACEKAHETSLNTARTNAQQYGNTEGEGRAYLQVTLDVLDVIEGSAELYSLGEGLYYSTVHGFAVACSSQCEPKVSIRIEQCGPVTVKGGGAAEVTYVFKGDPLECPAMVTVSIGGSVFNATPVPLIALNLDYEGAGDRGALGGEETQ